MLKTTTLVAAIAVAFSVLPVAAANSANSQTPATAALGDSDGGSLLQYRNAGWMGGPLPYFRDEDNKRPDVAAPRRQAVAAPAPAQNVRASPFEYVGGDGGWQLVQHKYVWGAGRFAHSDECDHAIRMAKGPTPTELESVRSLSPGA